MNHLLRRVALIAGLLLSALRAVASPDVDHMSDIEVSAYAERMSIALENIDQYQICEQRDTRCVRNEMARYGVSYDDKETVQKRLYIMIGSVH